MLRNNPLSFDPLMDAQCRGLFDQAFSAKCAKCAKVAKDAKGSVAALIRPGFVVLLGDLGVLGVKAER